MKYVIVIPDGASDEPHESLGGRTALEVAQLPTMDQISKAGVLGRSRNVPDRFLPGSDVATLCLFGYDPERYYTGRAPLEAAAMGVPLGPLDWAVRCNLISIRDGKIHDFTAGHISSGEGAQLIEAIQRELGTNQVEFFPGVSYRNLMVYRGRPGEVVFDSTTRTTPPHDVPDQPADDNRPRGAGSELLDLLMSRSEPILNAHPVNQSRRAAGKTEASTVWLWGQGQALTMPSFRQLHGLDGAIISAVDLVRGVGVLAGWERIDVPGATGYLDTDYAAKGRYAIEALKTHDIVCVHVEAPDEASHEGRGDAKVGALERIDRDIVDPVLTALRAYPEWRILISPDHSTLLRTKAHDRAPVPWAILGTGLGGAGSGKPYDEESARSSGGPYFERGHELMKLFLGR